MYYVLLIRLLILSSVPYTLLLSTSTFYVGFCVFQAWNFHLVLFYVFWDCLLWISFCCCCWCFLFFLYFQVFLYCSWSIFMRAPSKSLLDNSHISAISKLSPIVCFLLIQPEIFPFFGMAGEFQLETGHFHIMLWYRILLTLLCQLVFCDTALAGEGGCCLITAKWR